MCSLLLKRARHYLNSIRCGLAFCQGPGELEAHAKGATARTFPYPDATPSQVATLCVATRLRRHALRPLPVSGPRQEWVPATDAPTHHRLRRQALRSLPVSGPRQEWVVTRDITDCEAQLCDRSRPIATPGVAILGPGCDGSRGKIPNFPSTRKSHALAGCGWVGK